MIITDREFPLAVPTISPVLNNRLSSLRVPRIERWAQYSTARREKIRALASREAHEATDANLRYNAWRTT